MVVNGATGKPHVNAGRSIIEILWEELDSIMDRLMEDGEPDSEDFWWGHDDFNAEEHKEACREWGEERGRAQSMAYAIAVMMNPYAVDTPAVKKTAMARWEERQG